MNRFLKKEWQDTEIPEQIYTQARNRAWTAIQAEPGRPWVRHRVKIAYGLAATLALILLVCVSISKRQIQHPDHQAAETSAVRSQPGRAPLQASATPGAAVGGRIKSAPRAVHLAKIHSHRYADSHKTDGPDRIVLNFALPESGVRMIWILDKNFHLDGGTE